MPEVHQTIDVAAGLVFRAGRVLIAQRHDDAHLGGLWEFPGGKVEPGESFEQALVRELNEELGIEVRVGNIVESIIHDYPEKSVHLKFFQCEWISNEPQPHDCQDLAWITREQLGDYEFPAADARLLDKLRNSTDLWTESTDDRE